MKRKHFIIKRLIFLSAFIAALGLTPTSAQYKSEKEATIPLEHFYIERQGSGVLRKLLSKLHWGLSTGYGNTIFKHDLESFGVLQRGSGTPPEVFTPGNTGSAYSNWINDAVVSTSTRPITFSTSPDTASLGFRSTAFQIPLKATVHIEFDRYRIGGGYSFDYTNVGPFKPTSFKDDIGEYPLEKQGFFMKHYFAMLGASVYRYYEYMVVVDANIGGYKLGKQFNRALMQKGLYFNLGVTVEREMSEYFRLFVRPSYELKGYRLTIPESGGEVNHRLNAFQINVGATYRLPELRRCFLKTCHAQINHAHGNREYRSRRHPIYKKQNPHYGENYPNLIKYKGKNKKKLNPY